ncbi:DUF551 domain-containing protein [Escherichia coli]|uniref:DUF551 domain-containing protein n=1 Tax=Escherichia coli TaxID=562 RepID=UPI001D0876EA|nr:DUF551 domain-containing protein [Escherichia coli]MCB7005953.1 DUF551 domain-containing protein [Escherichia coli]MCB7033228.1 DUF551 domain-containing protein [Escherichia coli]MCB7047772.1 DUF551 domain-containing protein [Escherichia coli]
MTTITKERAEIKSFITGFLSDPAHDNQSSDSLLANVFRIALASLEADPVKRVNSDQMRRVCLEANRHLDKYDAMAKEVNKLLGRIAPPAPVVPEEATPENVEMLSGYVSTYKLTDSERDIAAEIWNACRAAMLQSGNFRENKDSSTNNFRKIPEASTSSPVTPDGWISCSERMPDDTKMLLAFSQGQIVAAYWNWVMSPIDYKKYRAFTYLSGNILDDVTHWMPLPEPPQEVNRG